MTGRKFIGVSKGFRALKDIIKPGDIVMMTDLRGVDFSNFDLRKITLIGCLLDFSDFNNALMENTCFKYCFITDPANVHGLNRKEGVILERNNFYLNNESILLSKELEFESVTEVLCKVTYYEFKDHVKLTDFVKDFVKVHDIASAMGFCYLFFNNEEWVRANMFVKFKQLLTSRNAEQILLSAYEDIYTFFLSFIKDPYLKSYYYNHLEDSLVPEKTNYPPYNVAKRLFNNLSSPLNEDKLVSILYIRALYFLEDYYALVNLSALAELLSDRDPIVKRESLELIKQLFSYFLTDSEKRHALIVACTPSLIINLQSETRDDITVSLDLIHYVSELDWNIKHYIYPLLNHQDSEIKERANNAMLSILYGEELQTFLKKYPPSRGYHFEIIQSNSSEILIEEEELERLLNSEKEATLVDGLYFLSFFDGKKHLPVILNNLNHSSETVRVQSLKTLSYNKDHLAGKNLSISYEDLQKLLNSNLVADVCDGISMLKYLPHSVLEEVISKFSNSPVKEIREELVKAIAEIEGK